MSDLDDLLADLADDSGDEGNKSEPDNLELDEEQEAINAQDKNKTQENIGTADGDHVNGDHDNSLGRLLHGRSMQEVLRQIDEYSGKQQRRILGIIEADPEYMLIIKANDISMEIDDEIKRVVEFIKQRYAIRFPELEKIVLHPLQYVRAVRVIGNNSDLVHLKLNEIVSNSLAMSIAVTATTTDGRLLTQEELSSIDQACRIALDLDTAKSKIINYVQSRIETIAPNVTKIVGPLCAAKLIGQAGGVTGLAKCPSCNVPSLGKKQGIMNGFSKIGSQAQGFLYFCELVQSVPDDVRKQAQRQISGKVILAARIDSVHESPSGERGLQFKDELLKKMDKLSEPPDLKDVKALPAPDDPAKSRRGGKKVRKAKEKYAITELQKLRNRMAFGKEEDEVGYGDESEGMGMIGSSSSIRAPVIDKRTRAKLPKAKMKGGQLTGPSALLSNRPDHAAMRLPSLGSSSVSGMQSSLSFSSVQGIELPSLNVDALKKKDDGKWFMGGTYSQIKKP
ncbi:Pre-mRNA-processing factor 31 [Taphrina deformans PYCC 5710]|uniref:Pre-mRNA-processing factor 31 n=1 Tax=Taphrina deformans (strain PYCC 5710 / ATCC 11124 / CBS 356.35 / IMI 108563 / JCM 9778 / NBRC 8474) TaxID=1097556 RepID=R4XAH3_TAPDE|nr:Pre-mRNA-processing factor 31 [Taphrina deformans PYCC 5710]|eukprot:CCG82507.1 Pre-mRNA-processing factor 31 [Taphrina deformans PYCC 5710]